MHMPTNASRRDFLKDGAIATAGLVVGFHLPVAGAQTGAPGIAGVEVNAWVVIRPDNVVIIRYARSEMGQGSLTSAPMLVAEELECDWKQVKVEYASVNEHVRRNRVWGSMAAVGSQTIRFSQEYLRKAGATARQMLLTAAAKRWAVAESSLAVKGGVITHVPSGRTLNFGELAIEASKLPVPTDVKLKDPKDWKLAGTSVKRLDIPDTVMGRQRYGVDVQLPGMLYAAVAQCPVFGGTARSFDAAAVQSRRGIRKVFTIDGGKAVVVVADNWWRAKEALKVLPVQWDVGANGAVSSQSIRGFLEAGLKAPTAPVAKRAGDADRAMAGAAKVIEAEYYTPYLCHAPMEPMGCTARIKDGRVDVWVSTQTGEGTIASAAAAAGVPLEQVEVYKMQNGGGFGRRGGSQDFTRIGVLIAKEFPGVPVKSLWTREEDTQHDFYRPVALYGLKAGFDAAGNPVAFRARVAAPSIFSSLLRLPLKDGIDNSAVEGFAEFPYAIPNVLNDYAQRDTHVPVGFWRTVGWSQNPFARECFIDEMAGVAGKDPLEFRRGLLAHEKRPLGILEAVAKAAGWGSPLPPGVFRGIAVTEPYGSYTAAVIEVSVSPKGELKIHRIVQGIDCGYVVNPDNIVAQLQGSVVYALTAISRGEITIKDGRVEQSNFVDYPMLRMPEMPKVEVVIAPTGGFWGGVGEPAQAPIAPALCNAIFAATGKRIRSLPLSQHGLTLVKA
jgi:isoquinoline 1-oxidoreductase beta subunit